MDLQEIIVLILVGIAIAFSARHFIHQFTHGDKASAKCAGCQLNQAATQNKNKPTVFTPD